MREGRKVDIEKTNRVQMTNWKAEKMKSLRTKSLPASDFSTVSPEARPAHEFKSLLSWVFMLDGWGKIGPLDDQKAFAPLLCRTQSNNINQPQSNMN